MTLSPRAGTRSGRRSQHAMTTLEASWFPALLLLLERAGYREETYFTVTHAPAFGDDGRVAGMHAVCYEVTGQIIGDRRQRLLHDLSAAGRHRRRAETVAAMCRALDGDSFDVPFAAVYLAVRGRAAAPGRLGGLRRRTASREHRGRDPRTSPGSTGSTFPAARWATASPRPSSSRSPSAGRRAAGRAARRESPNLALDEEYRSFYELMAGQFAGAVATVRAFETERRRAESLAELDRAKTTFFSDVSHELRTPLTLLLGPIGDVLEDPAAPLPAGVQEQLSLALRNGQRLQRLVNDLLDFASIEAGRAAPAARGDRRRHVHRRARRHLPRGRRARRAAADRRLPAAGPPGLRRPADVGEGRRQPAGQRGQVHVRRRHRRRARAADDDPFVLTVTDTGVGIVAEELPQLFQRFHRVAGAPPAPGRAPGSGWRWCTSSPPCTAAPSRWRASRDRQHVHRRAAVRHGRRGRRRERPTARPRRPAARRQSWEQTRARPGRARRPARAPTSWSSTTTPTCAPT